MSLSDDELTRDDAAIARCLSLEEREAADTDAQIARDAALAKTLSRDVASALPALDFDVALDEAIARAVASKDAVSGDVRSDPSGDAFVPKLNDVETLPASNVVDVDHGRLQLRLDFYGLREKIVKGDGNCQFRALSDQLFRDGGANHEEVRSSVVERLLSNPDDYAPYCAPMSIDEYVQRMSKPGEWGDHITLQAASDAYGVEINVLTSYMQAGFIEIQPQDTDAVRNSPRALWISFFAEVHYNSIIPGPTMTVTTTR